MMVCHHFPHRRRWYAWRQLASQSSSSPEALSLPNRLCCPVKLTLLWPHLLRLSGIPADLCIRRRPCPHPFSRGPGEGPQFNLPICALRAASRTPADRTIPSVAVVDCLALAFAMVDWPGIPPRTSSALARFQRGCRVRSLRPEEFVVPSPIRAFTFELSPPTVTSWRRRIRGLRGQTVNSRDRTFTAISSLAAGDRPRRVAL